MNLVTIFDPTTTPPTSTSEYWPLGAPRSLDLPEARRLADLISMWHDFDMAVTCLNRLIEARAAVDAEQDPILEHAMWTAAVVHYTRCFSTGRRQRVLTRATIGRQLPDELTLHDWLMELRNKHIAHDESLAWQFDGAVGIWELADGRWIAQVGVSRVTLIAAEVELATRARDHMTAVGDLLRDRIERARDACTERIARMSFDEVRGLPEVHLNVPSAPDSVLPRPGVPGSLKRRRR